MLKETFLIYFSSLLLLINEFTGSIAKMRKPPDYKG